MSSKIHIAELKQIIRDELKTLKENVEIDHEVAKDVVTKASKLLSAIKTFNDGLGELPQVIGAVSIDLKRVEDALKAMVENPALYAVKKKTPKVQKVSLTSKNKI